MAQQQQQHQHRQQHPRPYVLCRFMRVTELQWARQLLCGQMLLQGRLHGHVLWRRSRWCRGEFVPPEYPYSLAWTHNMPDTSTLPPLPHSLTHSLTHSRRAQTPAPRRTAVCTADVSGETVSVKTFTPGSNARSHQAEVRACQCSISRPSLSNRTQVSRCCARRTGSGGVVVVHGRQ